MGYIHLTFHKPIGSIQVFRGVPTSHFFHPKVFKLGAHLSLSYLQRKIVPYLETPYLNYTNACSAVCCATRAIHISSLSVFEAKKLSNARRQTTTDKRLS